MRRYPAERIICLTEETVETLYLLGEQDRIVGVSGYAVRPPGVRKEKPRISSFLSADIERIIALEPDLILAFSDIQGPIVADLAKRGLPVYLFNQRDIAGIFAMIRTLGALIDCTGKADALARTLETRLAGIAEQAKGRTTRPRVYFEEWDAPMISAIGWVSELIEIAGGTDVFADLRAKAAASERVVTSEQVIERAPDVILASWCGKKVKLDSFKTRAGWSAIPAVATGRIVEIKSPIILQPGPAALTDGLDAILAALA
ncbi:MAG: cobalamin-binding protein [Hyphomicrobium zavarzinii]|uniref:cobalamin-binding protein n=1 Tax=Hyphomicrobium zavarzinii TaxID=48292 RepID=UPI001A39CF1D|nr:cobalamin-binding protein [Hyphomicrobium zavarzinii]MBL8847829.1 cobalamin-binding protein [Hyphomicrobium zavarzinii]